MATANYKFKSTGLTSKTHSLFLSFVSNMHATLACEDNGTPDLQYK